MARYPAMASVSTSVKRAFVRYLLRLAAAKSTSLLSAIQSASDGQVQRVGRGKVLVSTLANLHEDRFQVPDDFTTTDAMELLSQLEDRYEEALAAVTSGSNPTPTDTQVAAEMLDKLRPVRSTARDYTNLRWAFVDTDTQPEVLI